MFIGAGMGWEVGYGIAKTAGGAGNPDAGAGGDTTVTPTLGADANTPGSTAPQTIPTPSDIALEEAGIRNLQIEQFQQDSMNQIVQMRATAVQQIGASVSGAAARNIDIKTSPLYNIATARTEAEKQIGLAETTMNRGVETQRLTSLAAWNSFLVQSNRERNKQQQEIADMWGGIFSDVIGFGTESMKRYDVPTTPKSSASSPGSGSTDGVFSDWWLQR